MSPVVGVMLMIIVTIIIAAVVSGFGGTLVSGQDKTPTITADVRIVNAGYYYPSIFQMKVTGVSEPIPTKDVKIVTTWSSKTGEKNQTMVMPNIGNQHYGSYNYPAPLGSGPGVENYKMVNQRDPAQYYGNYSLVVGTSIFAYPCGAWGPTSNASYGGYGPVTASYKYVTGTGYTYGTDIDDVQAVMGYNWNATRPGDIVNIKLIHIPTGKTIFNKDVPVEGA